MKRATLLNNKIGKIRLVQFLTAEVVLTAGLFYIFGDIPINILLPLSLSLLIPQILSEPHFTAPRAALITSLSQLGSYLSSDRSTQGILWNFLLVSSILVVISSVISLWRQETSGTVFRWVATRLGKAIVLGSIVSVTLILQVAQSNSGQATMLAALVAIMYLITYLDWHWLILKSTRSNKELAFIVAFSAPNLLLVSTYTKYVVGTRVSVSGGNGSSSGYIADNLASNTGSRYRVVLDSHWTEVAEKAETFCELRQLDDEHGDLLGFAIAGSTESTVRLNPVSDLTIGQTLVLTHQNNAVLYQVVSLNLEEEVWSGSSALVPRATLLQIGALTHDGQIQVRATLPMPYQPATSRLPETYELGKDFLKIGVLKGTEIPVGIRTGWLSGHGHLAVLGMSGMGKTSTTSKLAALAKSEDLFVMLDETSEYRTRLGYESTAPANLDWTKGGVFLTEPSGELPEECKKIVEAAMSTAQAEYSAGLEPRRRFILLEEAHGWLPEWNFTNNTQVPHVNKTTRFILQARKFNITFILVSQRTAVISKSAISQCENYILLRTLDQTSLDYVEGVVGKDIKNMIPTLGRYEAVCVGPIFNSDGPIVVSLDPPAAREIIQ